MCACHQLPPSHSTVTSHGRHQVHDSAPWWLHVSDPYLYCYQSTMACHCVTISFPFLTHDGWLSRYFYDYLTFFLCCDHHVGQMATAWGRVVPPWCVHSNRQAPGRRQYPGDTKRLSFHYLMLRLLKVDYNNIHHVWHAAWVKPLTEGCKWSGQWLPLTAFRHQRALSPSCDRQM